MGIIISEGKAIDISDAGEALCGLIPHLPSKFVNSFSRSGVSGTDQLTHCDEFLVILKFLMLKLVM